MKLLPLFAALVFASPALAQTRVLPAPEIRSNGDVILGPIKLGYRSSGAFTATPDQIVLQGNQQLCFIGVNLCHRYNTTSGRYEFIWNAVNIWSFDGGGNLSINGNFTPQGNIQFTSATGSAGSTNKMALFGSLRGSPAGQADYGFGISSASLDYIVPNGSFHTFYASGNAGSIFKITSNGYMEPQSIPPANSSAACTSGEHRWDFSYEYRCVTTNKWRRVLLQDF